jgi:hypothetical protein
MFAMACVHYGQEPGPRCVAANHGLARRVSDTLSGNVLAGPCGRGRLRVLAIVPHPLAGQALLACLARSRVAEPPGPARVPR